MLVHKLVIDSVVWWATVRRKSLSVAVSSHAEPSHLSAKHELNGHFTGEVVSCVVEVVLLKEGSSIHDVSTINGLMYWDENVVGRHWSVEWVISVSKAKQSQENIYIVHVDLVLVFRHQDGIVPDLLLGIAQHLGVAVIPVVASSWWMVVGLIIAGLWVHRRDLVDVDSIHLICVYDFVANIGNGVLPEGGGWAHKHVKSSFSVDLKVVIRKVIANLGALGEGEIKVVACDIYELVIC